jgi:hypothetical protein
MEAQPEAGCTGADGYDKGTRMFARIVSIRRMLGLGFAATLVIAAGDGQPASAHVELLPQTSINYELAGTRPAETADVGYVNLPLADNVVTTLDSDEVVTTLPATGVGPSDPDKRVTHWLFVIGGALLGFGHLELARRKLTELKTVNSETDR